MATWTEVGVVVSVLPDSPRHGVNVGRVDAFYWNAPGLTPPALPTPVFRYGTAWHNYDLLLALAIAQLYNIDEWNSDQPLATLSGTVTYPDGSAAAATVVRLYNRDNNSKYIRETLTDGSGAFAFLNVPGGSSGTYYVIALDPEGGVIHDLATADRVAYNATVNLAFGIALPTIGLLWPLGGA
jgi:hypothetical protein